MMLMLDRIDRHTALMARMADTVGADFAEAMIDGSLTGADMRSAVLRCSRCGAEDACADWLDAQAEADGGQPAAPGFCANAELLDRLRP